MFKVIQEELEEEVIQYKISQNDHIITFKDWIVLLKGSEVFMAFFINILKSSTFEAFFWEVKPVNLKTIEEEFEFVITKSNKLSNVDTNQLSFKYYFKTGKDVVCFSNLRGDAQLIVPSPISETENYNHLANFVRKAPEYQVIELWKKVALEYEKLIGENSKWLSTAGLGVHWLHVRIDSRPKYYRFKSYKVSN